MEISASKSALPAFHLIIVAAGSGQRSGGDVPKQYRILGGKSVLARCMDEFKSFNISSLNLVTDLTHDIYLEAVSAHFPAHKRVAGGQDRAASVANGLHAIEGAAANDIVLVHDAARPFIDAADIAALLTAMGNAATLATPVTDTLRREEGDYVDRQGLWAIQTPQAFRYGLLCRAHSARTADMRATDDTALIAALGVPVTIVPGRRDNFKITTPDDWTLAEAMVRTTPRTGFGFDVHAFDPARPGPARLGGIDIPHDRALLGHSDADVALHAITDALLGAMALGDIGEHFPPSDPRWKNADSATFLEHAVRLIGEEGGVIGNIDLTVICEAPKIGPHRAAMQARIAGLCGLLPSQIGVKATTTEQLGFTGRREGIAAQAVATVMMPARQTPA